MSRTPPGPGSHPPRARAIRRSPPRARRTRPRPCGARPRARCTAARPIRAGRSQHAQRRSARRRRSHGPAGPAPRPWPARPRRRSLRCPRPSRRSRCCRASQSRAEPWVRLLASGCGAVPSPQSLPQRSRTRRGQPATARDTQMYLTSFSARSAEVRIEPRRAIGRAGRGQRRLVSVSRRPTARAATVSAATRRARSRR